MANSDEVVTNDFSQFLSFGDYIALYSEQDLGYLAADSSSQILNEPFVYSRQSYDLPENVPTMSMLLFEVCVCHRYKMDKRYRKLKEADDGSPNSADRLDKLKKLKDAAALEDKDNMQVMKRNIGRKLRFGDIIQLRHVFSGYFIHINSNKLSKIQKSAFKTVLLPYSAKSAQFQIVPKYKVDVEGAEVNIGAYVSFESMASRSYYFHTNPNPSYPRSETEPGISEFNVSLDKNGFIVYKSRSRDKNLKNLLNGLNIVHFYHQETEAYLTAEGYFRGEISEKIHMRIRKIDLLDIRSLTPSTNSNTYWVIEKANVPYSMDPIAWNDMIRLKHGSTGFYLTLNYKNKLFLSNNIHDPRTVLKFHPVNKDRDEFIRKGINVRVEHVISGRWLKVTPLITYTKDEFSNEIRSQVIWDNASFITVTMDDDQRYDDAFNIEDVAKPEKQIFHKFCGFAPIIKSLKGKISDPTSMNDESLTRYFTEAIGEISKNLCIQNNPTKNRQKMMRTTKLIDWLFQIIELFGNLPVTAQMKWITPCQEIFSLINLYIGNNSKNTDYVAKYFQIFTDPKWNNSPIISDVITMLTHMISSSPRVAEKVQLTHIKSILQMVHGNQNYVFLKFLSQTCSSKDVPIISNQDFIAQEWLVNDKSGLYLLQDGSAIGGIANTLYISTNAGKNWTQLSTFFDKTHYLYIESQCKFFLHQLDLLKAITTGRNMKVIEMITTKEKYITWSMAISCIQNEEMPDDFRAKFCELIITLFLNYGNHFMVMDYPITAYSYNNIGAPYSPSIRHKQEMHESFPAIREWIGNFIFQNSSLIYENTGRNHLIIQVFYLLLNLIKYGYFDDTSSLHELIDPILNVLDGKNDKKFRSSFNKGFTMMERDELQDFHYRSRFEVSECNNVIVDAKNAGLEVLEMLLMFQLNKRTEGLVHLFKGTRAAVMVNQDQRKQTDFMAQLFQENVDINNIKKASKECRSIETSLKSLMSSTQYFDIQRIREVLLDLTHYKYDSLLHKSLLFIAKFFSSQETVFTTATDMMITHGKDSDSWLKMIQDFAPQLDILITGDWNHSALSNYRSILASIRAYCTLPSCNIPNVVFQKILYSCNIVDILFKVFEKECGSKSGFSSKKAHIYRKISKIRPENHGKIYLMYGETMDCLKVMAKEMVGIQNILFSRLELIMSLENQTMMKKLSLIKVIFADREDLVVNVSPSVIEWLFKWIRLHKEDAPDILNLILCLGQVQYTQKLIRNNFIWIAKLIMKYWLDFGSFCEMSFEEKLDLFSKVDDSPEKMFFLRLLYLIGVAGEMGLEFVESFGQTVLSLDNCLNLFSEIPDLLVQRSILKFVSEIYIKSESNFKHTNYIVTDVTLLLKGRLFWNVIESIKETNVKWLDKLKQMSPQYQYDVLLAIRDAENLGDPDYLYMSWLMDGVIPFMTETLRAQTTSPVTVTQQQLMIENVKLIIQILTILSSNFSILHQIEIATGYLFAAVLSIYERYISLEPVIVKLSSNVRSDSVNSRQTFKEFLQTHKEEIDLNREFKNFLKNTHSLLVGKNSADSQIKYPGHPSGIRRLSNQEYTSVNTVEALPLGEEFQSLVQTFLNMDEIEPKKRFAKLINIIRHLKMPLPRMAAKAGFVTQKIVKDQDSLNIICFRILRAVLQNEIKRLPEDWPEYINNPAIDGQLQYIRNIQSAFCDFNLFESVLHHASRVKSPVTVELFAFLKVLFFNASTYVQEYIYNFFIVSVTETFFFAIKEFLAIFEEDMKKLRRNLNAKVKERIKEETQFRVRRQTLTNMNLTVYYECKDYFAEIDKIKKSVLNNVTPLKFQSIIENGFGILLMQVLQSLCEGQFLKLQDYMRVQEDNPKSFNLVFRTCTVVNTIYANINSNTIGILTQILGALNQMAIGNQENRITLVNGKIIDYINFILRTNEFNGAKPDQVLDLRDMVANLIITLVEEDATAAHELAKEIMITVDKKAIFNIILQYYQFSKKDALPNLEELTTFSKKPEEKTGILISLKRAILNLPTLKATQLKKMSAIKERIYDIGYKYSSILMRFEDIDPKLIPSIAEDDVTIQHKAAYKGLKKGGTSIEIIKDDCVQRVHFRIKNRKVIREDLIEKIKWDVDRTSSASKVRDFTLWADSVIMDLEKSKKANPVKIFMIQSWYLWNYLPILLSLVLNIMMLLSFKSKGSLIDETFSTNLTNPYPDFAHYPVLKIHMIYISTLHTIFSLCLLITYVLISKPGFNNIRQLKSYVERLCQQLPVTDSVKSNKNIKLLKEAEKRIDMLHESEQADAIIELKNLMRKIEQKSNNLAHANENEDNVNACNHGKNKLNANVLSLKSTYYFLFFLSSLLGTIFGAYATQITGSDKYLVAYYLFAFHLMNIALVVTDLTGVFQAVRQSLPSMAWVGLLILIIIYAFTLVIFVLFRDAMNMSSNLYCDTLGHCYTTLIRFGFIFDKWMELFVPQFDSKKNFVSVVYMSIFTVMLCIIVAIIMLNIIAGIIVDKFATARNLKDSKYDDMINYCFICSRSSYEFETKAKGFRYHILKEHNMWSYLYYMISLRSMKISDYTALQWHVHKMYKSKNLDFYPIDRALALTRNEELTEDEKLKETSEMLMSIIDEIDTNKLHREQLNRKQRQEKWKKEALGEGENTLKVETTERINLYNKNPSISIDYRQMDPAFEDLFIEEDLFCPSTNINSIPINMITFNPRESLNEDDERTENMNF